MIRPNTSEAIQFNALDSTGAALTGVTDLYVTIVDADPNSASFGQVWDWSTSAFSATPVDATEVMTAVNATYSPGLYSATWPGASAGLYTAIISQTPGTTVSNLPAVVELRVREDAAPGDAMTLETDAINAAAVAASAVSEIQSGLATAAAVAALPTAAGIADAVLDEALSGHVTAGTLGAAVALVDVAVSTRATNAGVWATAESTDAGTNGYAVSLMRKWITNQHYVDTTSSGRMRLFDDDASTVLLTWTLRDRDGNAITTPAGSPAQRGEAT